MRALLPATLLVAAALVAGCGDDCGSCAACKAVVTRVIDGDTVELASGDKVRYLMVDTPESTSGKDDCYGAEATEFNRQLVEGREVSLKYDKECRDRYGRLLAYVSVDGREVNSLLCERGYACALYIAPNGADREIEFKTCVATAKAGKVGMWGACDPVPCEK